MRSTLRRTWAEVSLDAIEHNYKALRARIGENVKFLGVVKADAYGHGAVHVARTLQELGADYLAVSSLDEAMELRANGIVMPILILGHTPTEQVPNLIANNITQTVTCLAKALNTMQPQPSSAQSCAFTSRWTPACRASAFCAQGGILKPVFPA